MTEPKGSSFWATLPGLVTAIAGMITAIAILVTTLATLPGFDADDSSAPPASPATSSTTTPSNSATTSSEPSNTTCDCDEPAWSPDGTQVAYVGPGSGVIRPIMVIDAAGGTPRRITTNGLGPSWAS